MGIPDFDTSLVALLLMIWKRMFKAHTGRIGKQLLNAILFLNVKGPSKSRYFLWEGVCGKLETFNDDLRNVPTNFELSWNHGDWTQKPLHHLLSKSPMDKQENFQIQITLQSYTRWCKIWYAIVCEITSRKFRLVSLLGLDRLISECIFFFFLANNVILSFACAHSSMTLFGIKKKYALTYQPVHDQVKPTNLNFLD